MPGSPSSLFSRSDLLITRPTVSGAHNLCYLAFAACALVSFFPYCKTYKRSVSGCMGLSTHGMIFVSHSSTLRRFKVSACGKSYQIRRCITTGLWQFFASHVRLISNLSDSPRRQAEHASIFLCCWTRPLFRRLCQAKLITDNWLERNMASFIAGPKVKTRGSSSPQEIVNAAKWKKEVYTAEDFPRQTDTLVSASSEPSRSSWFVDCLMFDLNLICIWAICTWTGSRSFERNGADMLIWKWLAHH